MNFGGFDDSGVIPFVLIADIASVFESAAVTYDKKTVNKNSPVSALAIGKWSKS